MAAGTTRAGRLSSSTSRLASLQAFAKTHKPALCVLLSQIVSATQNAAAKLIETHTDGRQTMSRRSEHGASASATSSSSSSSAAPVHPFQVLHVRMLITGLACSWYLLRVRGGKWSGSGSGSGIGHGNSTNSNLWLGAPGVRWLVLLRAVAGVCGATGFFFSMIYLSLSVATALNFLGPLGAIVLTRYLSFATVQWTDYLGAVGALVGVVLIAQPEAVFEMLRLHVKCRNQSKTATTMGAAAAKGAGMVAGTSKKATDAMDVVPTGKAGDLLHGLAFGLLGIVGGVVALTSIRRIGTKAHALASVHAFAWAMVVVSGIGLAVKQDLTWPQSGWVWVLMIYIGVAGVASEFFFTVGIAEDLSSAATLMIYSQIVWALVLDSALLHAPANLWSILGVAAVVGSLCLVTLTGAKSTSGAPKMMDGTVYLELSSLGHGEEDEEEGSGNAYRDGEVFPLEAGHDGRGEAKKSMDLREPPV